MNAYPLARQELNMTLRKLFGHKEAAVTLLWAFGFIAMVAWWPAAILFLALAAAYISTA